MHICLIGGSGLVGEKTVRCALEDSSVQSIQVIIRSPLNLSHNKLRQIELTNFAQLNLLKNEIKADIFISCLGSTIKKAGTKQKFREIDFEYVINFAKLGCEVGAKKFITVSSVGANINSHIFYNRIKGEMEQGISQLGYKNIVIIRPSILLGNRKEKRLGETIATKLAPLYTPILCGSLSRYKPIQAINVAKCILKQANVQNEKDGFLVLEGNQILN